MAASGGRAGGGRRRRRVSSCSAAAMADHRPPPILSPLSSLPPATLPPPALSSISELQSSFASRLDSLRKDADRSYASLLKEIGSASARLAKRLKMEMQSCTQHMDELDRDWKAFSADFKEDIDEIKGDCDELVSRAQNAASHYTKKALPELMKSAEKDIEKLRSRFVFSTSTYGSVTDSKVAG